MEELSRLAELIQKRNTLETEITGLIGRPAEIGHIGEYIAARIFHIQLEISASHKSIDGLFNEGPLKGRAVNIKWYARREGVLDITPDALPDYYLILAGPKSKEMTSRGRTRPWTIENVYLFDAQALVNELKLGGVKMGIATSVRQHVWVEAEIFPTQRNELLELTDDQRRALMLFRLGESG